MINMPRIFHSSEMEGFYGVLYELVCPMLASDSCVKCITEDGSTTFTSDPEHLLRNVDIEHPAGELVLQALQSHKHTFGTGTKTLLFMLASLAKAVVQLSKLGIHSGDSLDVIRDVFTDLTKEVQEISVDTTECFNTSKQENFRRDINSCEASEKLKIDRKLTASDETEALHTPEAVLQHDIEKQGLLNVRSNKVQKFCGSGVEKKHFLLSQENDFISHSNLSSLSADSLPKLCHKPSTASCTTSEYNCNVAKLELDSVTCCGSGRVACSCSDKDITVMNVTEMSGYVVKGKSDGKIQDTQCASTDPVHLKMSNLQHLSGDTDDIDWFFDSISNPGCTEVNTSLTDGHISQDIIKSSNLSLNCFLCTGHQDSTICSLASTEREIQQNCFNINSPFHNQKDLSSSELQNTIVLNHENKLITNNGIHSLKDDKQDSSDFINIFYNNDKRLPFEAANSIFSEDLDNKVNVSIMQSCLVSKRNCVGSQLFSNLKHNTFSESNFLLADKQLPERYDEFDACFSDVHVQDSSVTCENAVIKHVNTSEFPSSCHMADNQLPERYDEFDACFCDLYVQDSSLSGENAVIKHVDDSVFPPSHHMVDSQLSEKDDDGEFDACFNDINDQHSSMTSENTTIKHIGGYENPLPCETVEIANNIKQKHLFPKDSRSSLCGVKVTNSMSGKDLKDAIRMLSMESSDNVTQKSEIRRLNELLEFFRGKKTNVGLPKLSRHLDHFQSKNLQDGGPESIASATIIDNSNSSSIHLIESNLYQGYLKDTFQDRGNVHSDISTDYMKNPLQAQDNYDTCSIENVPFRSSSQEHSEESNSSQQRETALCTREVYDDNKHKLNSWSKDSRMLLEKLLQKKKANFRSTITEKVMLSSRHFSKDSEKTQSCSSLLHENSGLIECTPNEGNRYFSYSKHVVTQNLSNDYLDCEGNAEFDSVNDSTSLIQNESVAISESSDAELGVCTPFQDQHVEAHTHTCSEASDINCVQDSACCPAEVLCNLSGEPEELNRANQPQDIVDFLHDCKNDVGDVAKYIFQNQIKDKEDARFNFRLVNCLLLPSLVSLPESFTTSWSSSTSPVSVTPGLVIPCDSQILEKLHLNGQSLVTLLIGGDLTPNAHHKGYVPTLTKRTLIVKPYDGKEESPERMWCTDVLDILKKLNVKLLLVKGKSSSVLLDLCEGAGVLLLTNISYHTLIVLSHLHKVDILTYLALATEENLCTVCLQPLSTSWMDYLHDTQLNTANQFAVITRTPDVQTAIIHCSNTMSAQLLEEKLWKCLHSIANSQIDDKVLPGQGRTEIWCAKQIRYKSGCMLGNQSMVQSVILEAVADIFQDYHRRVMFNTKFYLEEHIQKRNDTEINPVSTTQRRNNVGSPEHNCFSKIHHLPYEISTVFDSQTSNESFRTVSRNHMKQSVNKELDIFKLPESSVFKLKTSYGNTISDNSSENPNSLPSENIFYDNFKSKVSAWKTAVDVVSVLQSLGSLVISGIDTLDINDSVSLL